MLTSCPATNTYCPGNEPDNGCGKKCSTGTQDCSAPTPTPTPTLTGPGCPGTFTCNQDASKVCNTAEVPDSCGNTGHCGPGTKSCSGGSKCDNDTTNYHLGTDGVCRA